MIRVYWPYEERPGEVHIHERRREGMVFKLLWKYGEGWLIRACVRQDLDGKATDAANRTRLDMECESNTFDVFFQSMQRPVLFCNLQFTHTKRIRLLEGPEHSNRDIVS
jgi:hypothetical protein